MILENLKEVLIAAQFDRARLMVIKTVFEMTFRDVYPVLLMLDMYTYIHLCI